eukprot:TRINITY_DN25203_c0_g2_i1.p1 TRINITY_DN25203_c0_g2~~TRINITY_DN25203_c0_g2_i1.p1  ORF type:complete len:240 (+),score=43.78 TRINITY_DN25203_c0_g2_i1:80-721(+)
MPFAARLGLLGRQLDRRRIDSKTFIEILRCIRDNAVKDIDSVGGDEKAKSERVFLLSSESLTEGPPDKLCDQVSDGALDTRWRAEQTSMLPTSGAATKDNVVTAGGESTTRVKIDDLDVARVASTQTDSVNSDKDMVKLTSTELERTTARASEKSSDKLDAYMKHVDKLQNALGAKPNGNSCCVPQTKSSRSSPSNSMNWIGKDDDVRHKPCL